MSDDDYALSASVPDSDGEVGFQCLDGGYGFCAALMWCQIAHMHPFLPKKECVWADAHASTHTELGTAPWGIKQK